jgi:hypothetical protein
MHMLEPIVGSMGWIPCSSWSHVGGGTSLTALVTNNRLSSSRSVFLWKSNILVDEMHIHIVYLAFFCLKYLQEVFLSRLEWFRWSSIKKV